MGTGGFAVAVAGPAAAITSANTSLDCVVGTQGGQPSLSCTAASNSPALALHYIKVADLTTGTNFIVGSLTPCNQGGITNPQTLSFMTNPGDKYKVVVVNCQQPTANKDVYKVAPDGSVSVIKSV